MSRSLKYKVSSCPKFEARYALTSRCLCGFEENQFNPLVITQVERKVKRLVKVDHVLVSVFRYKYLMKTR